MKSRVDILLWGVVSPLPSLDRHGGPNMRTISRVLVCAAFACLLLSWISGLGRALPRVYPQDGSSRERCRVLARLRRCRGDSPAHHPVRPCKNAVLPPDDDKGDPERLHGKANHERLPPLCPERMHGPNSLPFSSRPLPTEVPRHQTLCILLI